MEAASSEVKISIYMGKSCSCNFSAYFVFSTNQAKECCENWGLKINDLRVLYHLMGS